MRTTVIIFILFIFTACDSNFDNTPLADKSTFNIRLAPTSAASSTLPLIPVNAQLVLYASTELDPATVNEKSIYILNPSGSIHPAKVSLSGQKIVIRPVIYLLPDETLEIIITTDVKSSDQKYYSKAASIPFKSGSLSDNTGPTLITSLPSASATSVEPYGVIYYQFSEAISPLYLDKNIIQVTLAAGSSPIAGETILTDALLAFVPDTNLTDNTQYNVELNTSAIIDLAGNPYIGTLDSNFTTGATVPASTPPEATSAYYIGSVINVIETDGDILYLGTEEGLRILKHPQGSSTFTPLAELHAQLTGAIYSMDLNSSIDRLYLGTSKGFITVDITDLNAPLLLNRYATLNTSSADVPVYGLDVIQEHAYLAATTIGLIDLNISDESTPYESFRVDTNGVAFDVKKIEGSLVLCDYDQGVLVFDLQGNPQTPPSPQVLGQDRQVFSVPTTDLSGNLSYDYYVAAGIGGIKYWDSFNGFGDLPSTTAASYISKFVQIKQSAIAYAVAEHLGVVKTNSSTPTTYLLMPYDVTTIGYIDYALNPDLLLVGSQDGFLHSYEVLE